MGSRRLTFILGSLAIVAITMLSQAAFIATPLHHLRGHVAKISLVAADIVVDYSLHQALATQSPTPAPAHPAPPPVQAALAPLPAPVPPADQQLNVPILLYHQPPPDLEAQLELLEQRNYVTVDLDQVAEAFEGQRVLPPKPVVITFDDGFESQLAAIDILQRHQMKATFYIINGGAASGYCIGANRHDLPCGDGYLTWGQIKALDHNPLFTIASHTQDHLDLSVQTEEVQTYQITHAKQELEAQLGHPVRHFAYPYGSFNQATLAIVHQAGYVTATTTAPGTVQTTAGLLQLKRVRSTYALP